MHAYVFALNPPIPALARYHFLPSLHVLSLSLSLVYTSKSIGPSIC